MTQELKKTCIHDFFGWKDVPRSGRAVRNEDVPLIRIFLRVRIVSPLRKNPQVMPSHTWEHGPFRCNGPALDVAF